VGERPKLLFRVATQQGPAKTCRPVDSESEDVGDAARPTRPRGESNRSTTPPANHAWPALTARPGSPRGGRRDDTGAVPAIPETVSMRMQAALPVESDPPETDARFAVLGRIGRLGWWRRLHAYGRAE
jgi:hypothetical protein